MSNNIQKRFLQDVKAHKMAVIRDNGDYERHIRFKSPDSIDYSFDIITWRWHLLITGDCGTYAFQRLEDMFEFFRTKNHDQNLSARLPINPGYWGEKLLSIDKNRGFEGFSADLFKKEVKKHFNIYKQDHKLNRKTAALLWESISEEVYLSDDRHEAINNIANFRWEHEDLEFEFYDFWDSDTNDYTFGYIWNLLAIVWGIKQYDKLKAKQAVISQKKSEAA